MGQGRAERLRPRSRVSENADASASRLVTLAGAGHGNFYFGGGGGIVFRATHQSKQEVPAADCLMADAKTALSASISASGNPQHIENRDLVCS
jgi:hypothetical protein